jgi:hypothetical protein
MPGPPRRLMMRPESGHIAAAVRPYRPNSVLTCGKCGALGGTRTPNLLIRRQRRERRRPGHTPSDLARRCSLVRIVDLY